MEFGLATRDDDYRGAGGPPFFAKTRLRLPRPPASTKRVASLLCLGYLVYLALNVLGNSGPQSQACGTAASHEPDALVRGLVEGLPTARFRDNLKNTTKYITSWTNAGWTNDVMTLGNMIYMGKITDRVPIMPPFVATEHVEWGSTPLPFGKVFDIPRFKKDAGIDLLDWHEVKQPDSEELEDIGCWSVWQTAHGENKPRDSFTPSTLKLDISYTGVPDWTVVGRNDHARFWPLAALAFPETRKSSLGTPLPSREHGVSLDPDDHLLCFDFLYYVTAGPELFEYEHDYSPAWNHVVSKLRFTPQVEEIARKYIRKTFGLKSNEPIPPYIALHVRHGDFLRMCGDKTKDECMTPLSTWAHTVELVQRELAEKHGISATRVVMTSDEKDPAWWADVTSLGWVKMDRTIDEPVERFSAWHDIIVDAIVQSSAMGLVGTAGSTMSLLAGRRTQDWHGGVYKLVHSVR
ncbi:hypothetical protein PUNSTDRAFT_131104 [Punctularia strigosozonata HHB-11173 SS5]|uniref:uncharacterized protein n=1 Tax=Punctularia strigosozonata (strain HHB-11173) TaxID=741275 RepID=UPI0004417E96|nr:uncharacterized protein PUNSTDRAFT_131104 [Punctularia strigosozonata HHB-11173 SS5]EIN12872.1 hypothetical protein PUNSTDRAFT_131104 [Punctularia strigosozonata HHB-11173 SS5]